VTSPANRWPTWEAGAEPWARHRPDRALLCPFCGDQSLKRSMGDIPDAGRLELYCYNSGCDARTMVVLLLRDGGFEAHRRADVRALQAIDDGPSPPQGPRPFADIDLDPAPLIARRQGRTALPESEDAE
jgi:hypothetical protein